MTSGLKKNVYLGELTDENFSDGNAICCISGFVDDVMFSHNGGNGPKSKTTRLVCPVRLVAEPAAKPAVFDCVMFIICIILRTYTMIQARGRGATRSRGSVDPPLFQVLCPHTYIHTYIHTYTQIYIAPKSSKTNRRRSTYGFGPPLFVRISWCMNAADNTFKLSDQWI